MAPKNLCAVISELLNQFHPEYLEVRDEGHLHKGHPGAALGGHYCVRLYASQFSSLSLVASHRLVYDCLSHLIGPSGDDCSGRIHALSIQILSSAVNH